MPEICDRGAGCLSAAHAVEYVDMLPLKVAVVGAASGRAQQHAELKARAGDSARSTACAWALAERGIQARHIAAAHRTQTRGLEAKSQEPS